MAAPRDSTPGALPTVRSLGTRLLLGVFATVACVLVGYALISIRTTQARFTRFAHDEAQRSSTLIRKATRDAMLLNRKEDVQSTIENIAQGSTITAIRVYHHDGRIVASSRPLEIGNLRSRDGAPCTTCHVSSRAESPAAPAAFDRADDPDARRGQVLRHLSIIANEQACARAGCHPTPEERPVLGILDVQVSTEPLDRAVRTATTQTVWTMAGLILLTGIVSAFFIRREVSLPVRTLREGTERIARGDLDTRIQVVGNHELADLGHAFNAMAGELRAARKEITDWSRRLEEKVVEKTDALQQTQRQVLHMEKMASLGKLAATVAHELNNPLSSVVTYARLVERELERGNFDEQTVAELRQDLRLVQQEVSRCGSIVRNLLLFSHRGGGTAMAPVDVNEIVRRTLMLTKHHLEMSNIELRSRLLDGDPILVADGNQIEQALVALIVNAVEAMTAAGARDHGGELSIELDGNASDIRIAVGDTGVGIHPDVLPHIFEPFFSTKDRESGVGLGLAVVYGIVERHGGAIEVTSEPGHGAVFHLRLPRQPRGDDAGVST